ncbi:MAG: amidohydrolase family protein [Ignavibacteriae bacterium]|nr:amidohydrolase family protein [Ignavibacteriota bacterium]
MRTRLFVILSEAKNLIKWGLAFVFSFFFFVSTSLAQIAVKGETVYTMSGAPIKNGVVLIKGKTIERVGPASQVNIPNGYKVMNAKVVTPGLVDAHTVVGLAGIYNVPHDQMQLETSSPVQPELRALDAYNPREELVEWVRNLGVTTMHAGTGPGALASGSSIVVKTHGNTITEVLVDPVGMVMFTLGESVNDNFDSPGTRSKSVAMIRSEFVKAQEYTKKLNEKDASKRPDRDLKLEALAKVLSGEMKALFTVQTAPDIMAVLRMAKEFGFKPVLDGAAESYLLVDEIKKAGVSVIVHPTMVRPGGDTRNVSMETAATLKKAGIPIALQSGFEGYVPKTRVILFEAAIAAANGLSFNDALAAITIDAARVIGVDKRVGSLETGKDADVVLFDGDPFEYTTHVCGVIVNGAVASETCR